jgi:hypothetical protein
MGKQNTVYSNFLKQKYDKYILKTSSQKFNNLDEIILSLKSVPELENLNNPILKIGFKSKIS